MLANLALRLLLACLISSLLHVLGAPGFPDLNKPLGEEIQAAMELLDVQRPHQVPSTDPYPLPSQSLSNLVQKKGKSKTGIPKLSRIWEDGQQVGNHLLWLLDDYFNKATQLVTHPEDSVSKSVYASTLHQYLTSLQYAASGHQRSYRFLFRKEAPSYAGPFTAIPYTYNGMLLDIRELRNLRALVKPLIGPTDIPGHFYAILGYKYREQDAGLVGTGNFEALRLAKPPTILAIVKSPSTLEPHAAKEFEEIYE